MVFLDAFVSGGANLFGLLSATVTGSLKYHKEKNVSLIQSLNYPLLQSWFLQTLDDSASLVMSYRARTREEILSTQLLSKINPGACNDIINSGLNVTHFVIGLSYGGSCHIKFRQANIKSLLLRLFNLKPLEIWWYYRLLFKDLQTDCNH